MSLNNENGAEYTAFKVAIFPIVFIETFFICYLTNFVLICFEIEDKLPRPELILGVLILSSPPAVIPDKLLISNEVANIPPTNTSF